MTQRLVEETDVPAGSREPHPGRDRKFYRLTARGRAVALAEARRLREVLEIARLRKLLLG